MKSNVRCKSGLRGWQGRLHEVYEDFEEFERYCFSNQIHSRLGFKSIRGCWDANPLCQGSVNPTDLRRVKEAKPKPDDMVTFTRRTDDPKLSWVEWQLDKLGIHHRRHGKSFHAPILQVPKKRLKEAWTVLAGKLDDIPDDAPRFKRFWKACHGQAYNPNQD